jgi:superfamily I DNA/RNA helicase
VTYLLEVGALPESILALTFSNRAAEEMRARLAVAHPDVAQRIWMGTFHAFGLELLRKYGSHLGLPPRPTVLDPVDAIALLQGAWLNCSSTTTST